MNSQRAPCSTIARCLVGAALLAAAPRVPSAETSDASAREEVSPAAWLRAPDRSEEWKAATARCGDLISSMR